MSDSLRKVIRKKFDVDVVATTGSGNEPRNGYQVVISRHRSRLPYQNTPKWWGSVYEVARIVTPYRKDSAAFAYALENLVVLRPTEPLPRPTEPR